MTTASGIAVCSRKCRANALHDHARGALHFAARLQDHAVRGFDRQRADLRDGVGPRLENDRQQAERAAYLFKFQTGVELDAIEHAADRDRAEGRRRARRRSSTASFAGESFRRSTMRVTICRRRARLARPATSSALAARISADAIARAPLRYGFERAIALLD